MAFSTPRAERIGLAVAITATLAVYSSSLWAWFTFDDDHTVHRHPAVTGPLSFSSLVQRDFWGSAFDGPEAIGSFRPLATFTYAIDHRLGGGAPWVFHLTNLLLLLVLLLVVHDFLSGWAREALSPVARLLVVLGFGVMTIHADVVPSITGRTEILAMLLSLVALARTTREHATLADVAIVGLATVGALSSKESTFPVPFLVAAFVARRAGRDPIRWAQAAASVTALMLVAAYRAPRLPFGKTGTVMMFDNQLVGRPFGARMLGAFETLTHYLQHAGSGLDLCPDYSYAGIPLSSGLGLRPLTGALLVLIALAGLALSWRRSPLVAEALLGFGATYAVMSHLLIPGSAIVADRVFFFPSFWLVVLLALGGQAIASRQPRVSPLLVLVGASIAAGQALLTVLLVPVWHDDYKLSSYAVRTCPNVSRLRGLRAEAAYLMGDPQETAWALLVRSAISIRYPQAVPVETFAAAWEDEPFEKRVPMLVQAIGSEKALRRVRALTRYDMRAQGFSAAEAVMDQWLGPPAP